MRKISLFILAVILMCLPVAAQDDSPPQKEEAASKSSEGISQLSKAYAYKPEMLIISEGDMNCSYFITDQIDEDLKIIGGEDMDTNKENYSDTEKLYINKGSEAGLKEGDMLQILEKGPAIANGLTKKNIGTLYLKKSLAKITCIYEDKAVITLQKGCHPVLIGDILIPYKAPTPLFRLKPKYKKCRIPSGDNVITGQVIHAYYHLDLTKVQAGNEDYLCIDLGKDQVSYGDILLFYNILREDLPRVIIGTGIVISPQDTNSTIKVIDVGLPIHVGSRFLVLEEESKTPTKKQMEKNEDIPIIKKMKSEEGVHEQENGKAMAVNVFFGMNEKAIAGKYQGQLQKIKEFVQSKSEYNIILRGYACSVGGLEHNLQLSKERVENIKAYLVNELRIPGDRIEAHYYGEKKAPFDNSTEKERRKNRLVNIEVIGK